MSHIKVYNQTQCGHGRGGTTTLSVSLSAHKVQPPTYPPGMSFMTRNLTLCLGSAFNSGAA